MLSVSGDVDVKLNNLPLADGDNSASNKSAQEVESEKKTEDFRDYTAKNNLYDRVAEFYHKNHKNQTYEFVQKMKEKYLPLKHSKMAIWEAFTMLEEIVDESDPDTDSAQIVHALQTAEACRKRHPDQDWFALAGLIHDLGKIMAHPKFGAEPQWCVVGDTFPVGCAYSDKCVYPEYFAENPDFSHPVYSTKYGVYKPNCGLENVDMTWGHDEYMYAVCKGNGCTLPDEALYVIRYHSFYPWHSGGAYTHLTNDRDQALLKWVKEFQKCDLYSKNDDASARPDINKLKPYYDGLIKKYFPTTVLNW